MTMGYRLTLRKRPDGRLTLSVPVVYRLLLGAIGVMILLAILFTSPEGERHLLAPGNTVPLIICALSLLGGAYHERWLFDRPGDTVVHRFGLGPIRVTRRYRLSDMASLGLEGARHNSRMEQAGGSLFRRRGPIRTLWLMGKEGTPHRLETYSPSQAARAAEAARTIAEYCELPLQAE